MQELQFRLFGFPVHVQLGFLFLAGIVLIFGLQAQTPMWSIAAFVGVIFLSILVHELGHALVARSLRVRVDGIWIHGFGGEVRHGDCPMGQRLAISLAGPFAGLALGAAAFALLFVVEHPAAVSILATAAGVNVFWSLFNLLPIYPMDGGMAMYAGLHFLVDPRPAALFTFGVGAVLGVGVGVLGWQAGFLFVTIFAGMFAWQNAQLFRRAWGMLPGPAREA